MNKKDVPKEKEKILGDIYSPFWSNFNEKQYSQATALFVGRLKANGFILEWFKNKVCLDAGCGSGRYVQAIIDLGAKEVIGIDLNPVIAKKNVTNPKAKILEGDIRKIPFKDEYFDFVCCNGVLHHTENPKEIIKELSRVLKPEGYLFLYVFDYNSIDWEVVDKLRVACKKIPVKRMHKFLKKDIYLFENKSFNFCDLLYAPIQLKFTKEELNNLLIGYDIKYLSIPFTNYDRIEENRLIAKKSKWGVDE